MFYTGKVPMEIKENRSILLPKGTTDLENVDNWRPLTISSVRFLLCSGVCLLNLLLGYGFYKHIIVFLLRFRIFTQVNLLPLASKSTFIGFLHDLRIDIAFG
jgi:hypothetical protein